MSHTRNRSVFLILAVLALLLAATLLAVGIASADDPVLWKQHCPRWHDVKTIPDDDWGGVHVICVRQGEFTDSR